MNLVEKLFGTHSERELKLIQPVIRQILDLQPTMQAMSDEELKAQTPKFKERLAQGETLDDILPEAFATVREAAKRSVGMEHFPVQLIVFFVISLVLLFATRPIAVKYLNRGRTKTNADSLVGRKAVVTKDIDNLKSEGEAEVSGQIWTARSDDEDVKIPAGAVVEILRISGVKLIVRDTAVKEHTEEQIQ